MPCIAVVWSATKHAHKADRRRQSKLLKKYDDMTCRPKLTKLNPIVLVRERTIPTERPPLVGEVIANFCG
jgi:hypothetical protein